MKIEFQHVVPLPMKEEIFTEQSVWGKSYLLDSENNYFISSESGKGKSTFLSFIFGIRNDFNGKLIIDNQDSKSISLNQWSDLRRTKLSLLLQDLRLFPHLTVWENLLLKNELTHHKTENEIFSFLQFFGLENKKNQLAGKLSLGQQQRIALIRSILQPFEFLLLDEPFSNIDDKNIELAKQLISQECEKNNAGFIIATLGYDYNIQNVKMVNL